MAAANNDQIIDKIMLINPVSFKKLYQNPDSKSKLLKKLITLPLVGTLLYNILINKKQLKETFIKDYFYDKSKVTDRDIDTYFEAAHLNQTNSKYLFASMISKYTNANVLNCLKNIKNSVFILTGNEISENIDVAKAYQNELASIEIVGIEKAKHLPQMELPKEVIEQIQILFDL